MLVAADERAHVPGAASWWWETWHLDVAGGDGSGLAVRLACAPALGVAWWWTHVLLPEDPRPVVVRDHEVGLPRQGLEVRADGLWGELTCEVPFEHWTYGLEAFGVRLDDPADSLRGEIGERMPVGLDLEWEIDPGASAPYEHRGRGIEGYEQFGSVHGEVLLGRSRLELDGAGLRSHTWGEMRFDRPETAAWFRTPELGVSFAAVGDRVDGYVAHAGATESIASVDTEMCCGSGGMPSSAHHVIDDRFELDVSVLGLVAVPIIDATGEPAVLARGLCRFDGAGTTGIGWSSWLDPEARSWGGVPPS
jgi:hypothetical protein